MNTPDNIYDFVIVHGSYGSPFENWFMWLFKKLEAKGFKVLVPQFPCGKENQNYENWFRILDSYSSFLGPKTTYIGHSLGPAFITDYLLDKSLKAKGLYFIAPLYQKLNISEFDNVNTPFFIRNDLEKLRELSETRVCFVSDNDPYVPNVISFDFAEKIGAEIKIVKEAGHFNTAAGYDTFPLLLEQLL